MSTELLTGQMSHTCYIYLHTNLSHRNCLKFLPVQLCGFSPVCEWLWNREPELRDEKLALAADSALLLRPMPHAQQVPLRASVPGEWSRFLRG